MSEAVFTFVDPYNGKKVKKGRGLHTVADESGIMIKLEVLSPNRGEWYPIAYPIDDWNEAQQKENKGGKGWRRTVSL